MVFTTGSIMPAPTVIHCVSKGRMTPGIVLNAEVSRPLHSCHSLADVWYLLVSLPACLVRDESPQIGVCCTYLFSLGAAVGVRRWWSKVQNTRLGKRTPQQPAVLLDVPSQAAADVWGVGNSSVWCCSWPL
jgi:hypothetical protein